MQEPEPHDRTSAGQETRADDPEPDFEVQKARYEETIARFELELERERKKVQSLIASHNGMAEALSSTHRNINERAHRIQWEGEGLVGRIRSMAVRFLSFRSRP